MPRRSEMKWSYFDDPVYLCRIFVAVGGEPVSAHKRFYDALGEPWDEGMEIAKSRGMVFLADGIKDCCVWIRDSRSPVWLIAHEAFHITKHILCASKVDLVEESEEAWAYHVGYVAQQIMDRMR